MKFGKSLSNQIEETLPEWNDKFLSYKDLKKRLKTISPEDQSSPPPAKRARTSTIITPEEAEFVSLLEAELEKFNAFFMEKEEEYVIRQKEIQDRMLANHNHADDGNLLKEIVDFHGEMVLLENYSALNYTGLVKILKKYDKRTGALLRLPFIKNVLQQPFFSTELLYKLIKECEAILDRLLPAAHTTIATAQPATTLPERDHVATTPPFTASIPDLDKIKYMEGVYMKSTVAALRVLKDIRKGSSTVSAFSLPPLQQQQHPYTTTATSTHVLEQTAK